MNSNSGVLCDDKIVTLSYQNWQHLHDIPINTVGSLEKGKVIFLPQLAFSLTVEEQQLLNPAVVDPKRKNISFRPNKPILTGVAEEQNREIIQQFLERHYHAATTFLWQLLPEYREFLHSPVNTLRLHPVTAWREHTSWRKDDSRLHVDAFPSRPNHGERILRFFTNINPHGEARLWRVGESFPQLAKRYFSQLRSYSPINSWILQQLRITKGRRSHYDHLMLQLHDKMKFDREYQTNGEQISVAFPPGSSWICFSDQTPHAAMSGQFMLEQTFLLPVSAMQNPQYSPLRVLEALAQQRLL